MSGYEQELACSCQLCASNEAYMDEHTRKTKKYRTGMLKKQSLSYMNTSDFFFINYFTILKFALSNNSNLLLLLVSIQTNLTARRRILPSKFADSLSPNGAGEGRAGSCPRFSYGVERLRTERWRQEGGQRRS